jgi:hypothetical protein
MSGIVGTSHSKSKIIGRSKDTVKAWVNFNGVGTVAIRDSFNVSSITDNGTGNWTINFIQNMANTDFSFTGTGSNNDTNDGYTYIVGGSYNYYVHSVNFKTGYYSSTSSAFTLYNALWIMVHVFGD